MKELDEKFEGTGEVKGVQFTQIAKSDKAYIYERDDEGVKTYEVFKKLASNGGTMMIDGQEVVFDPKIIYPNSKAFGVWAWAIASRKLAFYLFVELNKELAK